MQEINLAYQEIEEISGLKNNIGYQLLLDRIKAELDTVQQEFLAIGTPVNSEMVLYWRALYRLYVIFKVTPSDMEKEMEIIKNELKYSQEQNSVLPQEYLSILMKAYNDKLKNTKGV